MASKLVYDTVKTILGATAGGLPVYRPNDERGDAPRDASPFLAFEFPLSTSEQITYGDIGNNTFRETGALRIVIAAARGVDAHGNAGLDLALTAAETIRARFRNVQIGGLRFWEMSPPAMDDRNADGGFYRLTMACPYWLDFTA